VRSKKYECQQKIPWVRFAGNDISNYGLISNRNGARDQKIILMKSLTISRIHCVQNQTIVAFLSIYSQSGRNSKKDDQFDVHHPLGLLHSENDVSGIFTDKAFYQNV
jgi:hypothetical protein